MTTDHRADRNSRWLFRARHAFDLAVVALFLAVVMLAALPMGANRDWAWAPIAVCIGILSVCVAAGIGVGEGHRVRRSELWPLLWLILCFLLTMAVGFLQISSFAPSGGSARFYAAAAAALEQPIAAIPSLSIDATRDKLLKVTACAAIFVVTRAFCADHRRARLILMLFLCSVVLVMSYALLMHATNGSCNVGNYLKGHVRTVTGRELCLMSGTFVNSNSFACYCGMGLVAAIGLAFSRSDAASSDDFLGSHIGAWLRGPRMGWLTAGFLVSGGLLLAASRAGFIATLAGVLLLGVLLVRGRWAERPAVGWALVAALLGALFLGLVTGGTYFHRMAALSDGDIAGRVRIWEVAVAAIAESPWLGWGLGSFADIYATLQPADMVAPNDLAHSTPLETLVEMGVLGALPAFGLVALPMAICLRGALRRRSQHYLPATALAAVSVAVLHSAVDFSLQIPAIGFVASSLLGMGWAQSFRRYE
jgi:O-antigen ligase